MRKLRGFNSAERRREWRTLVWLRGVLRLFVAGCLVVVPLQALSARAQTRRRTPAAKAQAGDAARAHEEAAASLVRAVELLQAGERGEAQPPRRRAPSAGPRRSHAPPPLGGLLHPPGPPP